ncbi:MAG: TonB-dependent receptor [Spirochaetes bacterium]|nr:TonB-dependent receptor [Spirochaetota bacterium]
MIIYLIVTIFGINPVASKKVEDNDECIIVTGSRNKSNKLDVHGSVEIVDKKEIKERAPVGVGQAISEVPGVSLFTKSIIFMNPVIRGLGGRRVVMVLDGSILDSNKTMGLVGYFIDLNDIERIEIIKGPSSVLYGSGALGGVINIVSEDIFNLKKGFSGTLGSIYGLNNNEMTEYIKTAYNTGTAFVSLTLRYRNADNFEAGGGTVVQSTMFEDYYMSLRAGKKFGAHSFIFDARTYLGVDLGKSQDEEDFSKTRRIHFPHDRNYRSMLRYNYSNIGNVLEKISATLFYSMTDRKQRADIYDPTYTTIMNYTDKNGDIWNAGSTGHLLLKFSPQMEFTFGWDAIYRSMNSEIEYFNTDFLNPGDFFSVGTLREFRDATQSIGSLFGRGIYKVGDFSFMASARGDFVSTKGQIPAERNTANTVWISESSSDQAFSGSVGVVWKPEKTLAIKTIISSAFRAPDLHEIFFTGANCYGYTCGNTDLKPERSYNIDAGIIWKKGSSMFELNGFYYRVMDLINFGPVVPEDNAPEICELLYKNTQKAEITGIDATVKHKFPILGKTLGVLPFIKAGYTQARDLNTKEWIAGIPPLHINTGIRFEGRKFPNPGQYFLQTAIRWEAKQNHVATGEDKSDAFFLFNASVGITVPLYQYLESASFFISGTNLLDKKYSSHLSSALNPGRQIKFIVEVKY